MKLTHSLMVITLASCLSFPLLAENAGVAKVVILRGQVKAKLLNGSVIDVKADQSIPEGSVIQTAEKSFVKLIFIDKSQMNLGPNSQMVINSFPKKEAGIITLVKGQIRSQVTKDYMEIDDKNKSKLYIKTKTAAMGIRGTDFQVNFNPVNQNTSLITFEGKVAMAHIDKGVREERFDQGRLEKVVSSDMAVMVSHGQISAVNSNVSERAMAPTLLGTKQIEALKENETGIKDTSVDTEQKQYRNPIPPGADTTVFSNISEEVSKYGGDSSAKSEMNDPNGYFNAKTGEYKLPAGSIVDLNTVNIIPPPANAVFDPNTKTFVVPENFGKIDKTTGEYKAPEGLKLGTDGKFILVDPESFKKSQMINKEEKKDDGTRNPASVEGASVLPPPPPAGTAPVKIELPKIYDARPEMALFTERFAPIKPLDGQFMTEAQRALAEERIMTTETVRETAADLGTSSPNSKVNFKFNVQ